jgi:hypothetical protein
MANIALKTVDRVEVEESIIQMTLVAAEAITAGNAVRVDTSGMFTNSNASTTTENRIYGLATATVVAGQALTAIRKGVMDGYTLAGAYDSVVYLSDTDGRIADSAGTVSTIVGRVIPGTANLLGTSPDKLLFVDL